MARKKPTVNRIKKLAVPLEYMYFSKYTKVKM